MRSSGVWGWKPCPWGQGGTLLSLVVGRVLQSNGNSTPAWQSGTGSPEGVKFAVVGSLYSRSDGVAGQCLYVKETGSGATGWVAK